MEKEISVIVPVYNEQDNIFELYNRLLTSVTSITSNYEFIFVNDGSNDNSLLELIKLSNQDDNVFYINFSRNFGHQIAVTAGLKFCTGNSVVIIDADLQDPPELIPELYGKYKEGFNVIYAKREIREGETLLKRATSKLFYRILKRLISFEMPLDTGDFRLIDKKVVKVLNNMPEQSKFLRGQVAWLGFKQTHVLFNRDNRKNGKSGYSYGKMFKLAMDGITGFSDIPLVFVSRLGLAISFLSFIVILYAIFAHFVLKETITGWTSLIISSLFIGGIQLLSVGIIGEYISRINKNTNNRPLYIIDKSNIQDLKDNI
ncbi:dolichol-phosphate mannosyltransferase [Mariniflexile fucanivorans]|uniref:Dolichol-phosphate mannosyltransferase n=1 Tax=Mariniflexile fucanivorans TaxID=264023 RepID=A0A4V6NGX0_9FLAO|nr:glycosyltransferase family 2 protein [Mariniflexile fucanivorans]TCL66657.1 dolichol-phosphate mannosyltransferase [Mariniflexile fucanivorans]